MWALCTPPFKGKSLWFTAPFAVCFEDSSASKFSGGQLRLERIALRPFDSKLATHIIHDVGPIDTWKGHSCHGEEANIAEDEHLGDHSYRKRKESHSFPKKQRTTTGTSATKPLRANRCFQGPLLP